MCPSEAVTFGGTRSPFALIGDVNFDHLGKMAYQFYMYIHIHTYIHYVMNHRSICEDIYIYVLYTCCVYVYG